MRQGTTPTYTLVVEGYDLTDKTVYVTLRAGGKRVTLTGDRLTVVYDDTDSTIAFRMTQQETFALPLGDVDVQVRFIDSNGVAMATVIKQVDNNRVLLNEVIDYDGGDDNG